MILKRNLWLIDLIYSCSSHLSNKRYAIIVNEQRKSTDNFHFSESEVATDISRNEHFAAGGCNLCCKV